MIYANRERAETAAAELNAAHPDTRNSRRYRYRAILTPQGWSIRLSFI